MIIYLHLCASNDRNGNPRRCFVVIDKYGSVIDVIDEGYSGKAAVTRKWPSVKEGPRINVPPKEYRSYLKFGSDSG